MIVIYFILGDVLLVFESIKMGGFVTLNGVRLGVGTSD